MTLPPTLANELGTSHQVGGTSWRRRSHWGKPPFELITHHDNDSGYIAKGQPPPIPNNVLQAIPPIKIPTGSVYEQLLLVDAMLFIPISLEDAPQRMMQEGGMSC